MFDTNEKLIGTEINGLPVLHIDELYDFCSSNNVTIGVLTVPKDAAYKVAMTMARAGVKGIWNFAVTELELDVDGVSIENVHMGDSLMRLCYDIKTQNEETTDDEA